MAAFSALRLAKFNIDERQTTSFIGLPTPANALFWGALIVGSGDRLTGYPQVSVWVLVFLALLFSWLMVSEIPMFSLKFHNLHWGENHLRFLFLIADALILIVAAIAGGLTDCVGSFALIIGLYIILSLINGPR